MKSVDIFFSLTRDFEGFGYSIAESLIAKTPVVSTKVGGTIEFLNKDNSELINSRDVKKISKILEKFSENRLNFKKKTGHTGFKGSWLTFWLKSLYAKICGVSKDVPTNPSLFNTLKLKKSILDLRVDIRNLSALKKLVKTFKPDFVFHLAAQSLVKKSYLDPTYSFTTNAIGTGNLLESLRYLKNKCNVVLITSDKSYKNL